MIESSLMEDSDELMRAYECQFHEFEVPLNATVPIFIQPSQSLQGQTPNIWVRTAIILHDLYTAVQSGSSLVAWAQETDHPLSMLYTHQIYHRLLLLCMSLMQGLACSAMISRVSSLSKHPGFVFCKTALTSSCVKHELKSDYCFKNRQASSSQRTQPLRKVCQNRSYSLQQGQHHAYRECDKNSSNHSNQELGVTWRVTGSSELDICNASTVYLDATELALAKTLSIAIIVYTPDKEEKPYRG